MFKKLLKTFFSFSLCVLSFYIHWILLLFFKFNSFIILFLLIWVLRWSYWIALIQIYYIKRLNKLVACKMDASNACLMNGMHPPHCIGAQFLTAVRIRFQFIVSATAQHFNQTNNQHTHTVNAGYCLGYLRYSIAWFW